MVIEPEGPTPQILKPAIRHNYKPVQPIPHHCNSLLQVLFQFSIGLLSQKFLYQNLLWIFLSSIQSTSLTHHTLFALNTPILCVILCYPFKSSPVSPNHFLLTVIYVLPSEQKIFPQYLPIQFTNKNFVRISWFVMLSGPMPSQHGAYPEVVDGGNNPQVCSIVDIWRIISQEQPTRGGLSDWGLGIVHKQCVIIKAKEQTLLCKMFCVWNIYKGLRIFIYGKWMYWLWIVSKGRLWYQ